MSSGPEQKVLMNKHEINELQVTALFEDGKRKHQKQTNKKKQAEKQRDTFIRSIFFIVSCKPPPALILRMEIQRRAGRRAAVPHFY